MWETALAFAIWGSYGALLTAAHIDRLREVDTERIAPTAQVVPLQNRMREDRVEAGLTQDQALANAPETRDGYFVVGAIQEAEP